MPVAPAAVRVCATEYRLHGAFEARADAAGAGGPRFRLGRSAHADARRAAPARCAPAALRDFVRRSGVSKANSVAEFASFEFSIRELLNKTAPRRMAVLRPLKLVIENYPEGKTETLEAINNPEDMSAGTRPDHLRARALYRARRFHGESAEEVFSPVAGTRSKAALRLLRHLPQAMKNAAGEVVELRCT